MTARRKDKPTAPVPQLRATQALVDALWLLAETADVPVPINAPGLQLRWVIADYLDPAGCAFIRPDGTPVISELGRQQLAYWRSQGWVTP